MDLKLEYEILNLAGDVGELLLENGSEVYRVEKNVNLVAEHFGFKVQCFATLTCLLITIENESGELKTIVRRVFDRNVNLDKVYMISNLVNNIEKYNITSLREQLKIISEKKSYSEIVDIFAHGIGAAFFTILFLGTVNSFVVAFFNGIVIGVFSYFSNKGKLGIFFSNLLASFIIAFLTCIYKELHLIKNISIPIISSLMLLVPGVAYINSMRDIFSGDLVTGMSRLVEVAMIGSAIALGAGMALNTFIYLGGSI